MYYFFAMRKVQCLSLDLCRSLYCSHGAYCPFLMVEGLDVAMRGESGGGGGGGGEGEVEGFAML